MACFTLNYMSETTKSFEVFWHDLPYKIITCWLIWPQDISAHSIMTSSYIQCATMGMAVWRNHQKYEMVSMETGSNLISSTEVSLIYGIASIHDDVIKWKHLPRNWPFLRGIHRSPVNSPHKRPVTRSFDVYFDLRPNKRLSKQSWGWWIETPSRPFWRHRNDCNQICLTVAHATV